MHNYDSTLLFVSQLFIGIRYHVESYIRAFLYDIFSVYRKTNTFSIETPLEVQSIKRLKNTGNLAGINKGYGVWKTRHVSVWTLFRQTTQTYTTKGNVVCPTITIQV